MADKTFLVQGMTCNHCKSRVEKSIATISGVQEATADLATGKVLVTGNEIDESKVREVVEDAGYSFGGEA